MSFLSEILSCNGGKTYIADGEGRIAAEVLDSGRSERVRKIPYLNDDWRNKHESSQIGWNPWQMVRKV